MHGVPQGSILVPLFFILFINDLPLYTSAQLDLYADDTTVTAFADVKNLATLSSSLNKSVSEIQLWASANKLPLNEDKTKVLTITGKSFVANINGSDIDVFVNGKQFSNVDCVNSLLLVKHSNFACTCFQGRIYGCISQYLFKYKKYVTDVVVLCYFGAKLFLSCSK